MGNGEYELGIVRPLQPYTSWQEQVQHVPLEMESMTTWGALSSFIAYREDISHWIKNVGGNRELVSDHDPGLWWFQWSAQHDEDFCALLPVDPVQQASPCEGALKSRGPGYVEKTMRSYCRMPVLADVVSARDLKQWSEEQLPGLQTAWENYLRHLGAKYRVLVLSLPIPTVYRQRSMLDELTSASDALLESLAAEGVIDWLDLRWVLNTQNRPECAYFRDPWHLNRLGQQEVTAELGAYLKQTWYRK